MFICDYLNPQFTQHFDKNTVTTILELGMFDGMDSLALQTHFDARVIGFECNPEIINVCKNRIRNNEQISVLEYAAWEEDSQISFYPVISILDSKGNRIRDSYGELVVNPGASSCFRARADYLQFYEQREIQVNARRVESVLKEIPFVSPFTIDLICIDVQGAALQALRGVGRYLNDVRFIIVELEKKEIYYNQSMAKEVVEFLQKKGFRQREEVPRDDWFSDFLFTRE